MRTPEEQKRFVNAYGCVQCQAYHNEDSPLYELHIHFQSKHGIIRREYFLEEAGITLPSGEPYLKKP